MLTVASAHQTSHAESLIILCAQLRGVSCRISSCDVVVNARWGQLVWSCRYCGDFMNRHFGYDAMMGKAPLVLSYHCREWTRAAIHCIGFIQRQSLMALLRRIDSFCIALPCPGRTARSKTQRSSHPVLTGLHYHNYHTINRMTSWLPISEQH